VADFLREQGVEVKSAEVILSIISSMGFKEELGGSLNHDQCSLEFAIVQDADRLDAIGAIVDQALHEPSRMGEIGTT
jgi:uncharacterized protein